jgi:hypothetical protein
VLLVFFLIFIVGAILLGALRIILGWVVPVATLKRFDSVVSATFLLIFKLSIVGLAGIIVWVIWLGTRG